jgi:PST family polysaccharide transporter
MGVTVGYTLGLLAMWPLSVIWIAKVAPRVPAMELFNNGLRAIVGYGAAGAAAYFAARQWGGVSLWQQLAVGAAAMALGCVLVFALWPAFRRDVLAILHMRTLLRDARARR